MKRLLIGVLLVSAPPLYANAQPTTLTPDEKSSSQSKQADALMASWFKSDAPGAAVMVIKDGRTLLSKGYGLANRETKEAFGLDTPSLIGSMAKQFVAMAVMILAERGSLSFDDPLTKFFPEFSLPGQQITIRHLLNHTSGLPEFEDLLHNQMKVDFVTGKKGRIEVTAKDVLTAYAQRKEARFKPGERYEYNNGGYVVLSHVVEMASGKSFSNFVRENIFQPLEMDNSFFAEEPRLKTAYRAIGYFREWHGLKVSDYLDVLKLYNGSASIFSTAEDLRKWDQALYTEKLVKESTLKEAITPGKLNDGSVLNYGFGWELFRSKGTLYMMHEGGWGGFKSFIFRIPDQRFAVIALSNSGQFNQLKATQEISRIYLGAYLDVIPVPK